MTRVQGHEGSPGLKISVNNSFLKNNWFTDDLFVFLR
jgi:hypothetical protein